MSELKEYAMPQANPGMQILWYKKGVVDRTSVEVAYMLHTGARTAVICSMTGRRVDAVRHVDDPKLQLNADQRENGAWDYTDDYKEMLRFKLEVRSRLERLERHLSLAPLFVVDGEEVTPEAARPLTLKGQAAAERLAAHRRMLQRARELGVMLPAQATKAEIEQAIADAVAARARETFTEAAEEASPESAATTS